MVADVTLLMIILHPQIFILKKKVSMVLKKYEKCKYVGSTYANKQRRGTNKNKISRNILSHHFILRIQISFLKGVY